MINTIEELMATCGYQSEASIDWEEVSITQKLTEDFIREHKDLVSWSGISWKQKLSEAFIREHKDLVSWSGISWKKKLSESFIREYKDSVNWAWISRRQKLSDAFIEEFKEYYLEPEGGRVLASEFYCGNENRVIIIYSEDPTKIRISCFVGTQAEAIEAITKKYGETEVGLDYKAKVNKCFESVKEKLQ